MQLTSSEEKARQKLLRSKPEATARQAKSRTEGALAQGAHSAEIRKTFERSKPVLDQLQKQYPNVDKELILGCLKEQTIIAETWPQAQDRKKVVAWKKLCTAWDEFCSVTSQRPTLEQLKHVQKSLIQKGHTAHSPQMLYRKWFKKWPKFFQDLQATHHPPAPEAIGNKGRPTSFWSDGQARKLADHFREKTDTPQWKFVSALLECAPPIPGLKMSPEHIRQRLTDGIEIDSRRS